MVAIPETDLSLTLEQISDLLSAALEGGSNYWYRIEEKIEPAAWTFESDPKREAGHWYQDYPCNEGGALLISDINDEERTTTRLDLAAMQKGLKALAEKYPHHLENILEENADAETGDAFLQCSLFGDIIIS